MHLKRFWALRLLAYLALLTCHTLEASRCPSDVARFCFVFRIQMVPPPVAAPESSPSPAFHLLRARPVFGRHEVRSSSSPQLRVVPSSFRTQGVTRPLGRISPLFAGLSFLTAPDPISLGDGDLHESRGDPRSQSVECALPHPYVESNARYLRLSPIKTRRVVQELRGKTLAAALAHLASSPRRPALAIFRTIESAIANAVHLHGDGNVKPQLVSVTASNGPVMKRPFFKARGRLNIWRRPTTHIKVIIKAL